MKNVDAISFTRQEHDCELAFANRGPFWHLCTPGLKSDFLFADEEEYKVGMNLEGQLTDVMAMFANFKKRLSRYLSNKERPVVLDEFKPSEDMEPVKDLNALRNMILYVNRNGFVVNTQYTPQTYPWGAGMLFFSPPFSSRVNTYLAELSYREKRKMFASSSVFLPPLYCVSDGYVHPISYCDYQFASSLFRDAHHYLIDLLRNVEAFVEIDSKIGNKVILSNDDLFSAAAQLCKSEFKREKIILLSSDEKIRMAVMLHSKYNANNLQIQKILRLDPDIVNSLFPLKNLYKR